jgi:hypothetical protein
VWLRATQEDSEFVIAEVAEPPSKKKPVKRKVEEAPPPVSKRPAKGSKRPHGWDAVKVL